MFGKDISYKDFHKPDGIDWSLGWYKYGLFGESVYYYEDVSVSKGFGKLLYEIYGYEFPELRDNR